MWTSAGIRGIHVDMLAVIVGRSPSSDICINEPFVSASHARFSLQGTYYQGAQLA